MQPTLITPRLLLRPFDPADAPRVQILAGARELADTTLTIPHPYLDGMAEEWIASLAEAYVERSRVTFAVVEQGSGLLVAAVGLALRIEHARAELGYWTGVPYWGKGYATEASAAVLRFGFEELGLNRIFAHHFLRNPASGRVMQKLGMLFEGHLRQHIRRWGVFEDVHAYAILAEEWRQGAFAARAPG